MKLRNLPVGILRGADKICKTGDVRGRADGRRENILQTQT